MIIHKKYRRHVALVVLCGFVVQPSMYAAFPASLPTILNGLKNAGNLVLRIGEAGSKIAAAFGLGLVGAAAVTPAPPPEIKAKEAALKAAVASAKVAKEVVEKAPVDKVVKVAAILTQSTTTTKDATKGTVVKPVSAESTKTVSAAVSIQVEKTASATLPDTGVQGAKNLSSQSTPTSSTPAVEVPKQQMKNTKALRDPQYVPADKKTGATVSAETQVKVPTSKQAQSADFARRRQEIDGLRARGDHSRAWELEDNLNSDIRATWPQQVPVNKGTKSTTTTPASAKAASAQNSAQQTVPSQQVAPVQHSVASEAAVAKPLSVEPSQLPVIQEKPVSVSSDIPKPTPQPKPMPPIHPPQPRGFSYKIPLTIGVLTAPILFTALKNLLDAHNIPAENVTHEDCEKLAALYAAGDRVSADTLLLAKPSVDKAKQSNKGHFGTGSPGVQPPDDEKNKQLNKREAILNTPVEKLTWVEHGSRHRSPRDVPWDQLVKSTKNGPAKYKPEINIMELEAQAWTNGLPCVNVEKTFKVFKCNKIIGAYKGVETEYMIVKESAGTYHGHPIPYSEYLARLKTLK